MSSFPTERAAEIERDKALRDRILAGAPLAAEEFFKRYWPVLGATLQKAFAGNAKALREVDDIAIEVMLTYLSDRHGGKCALAAWTADVPLIASLITAAKRRMWDFLDGHAHEVEANDESPAPSAPAALDKKEAVPAAPQPKTIHAAKRLATAVQQVAAGRPRDMSLFLLKQAGVEQGLAASQIWRLKKATASRALDRLVADIAKELQGPLGADQEPLIRHFFPHAWNGVLPGKDAPSELTGQDEAELRLLAEGPPGTAGGNNEEEDAGSADYVKLLDRWSERLWREPEAVEWLARCLKAGQLAQPPILSNTQAGITRGRLDLAIQRAMHLLKPHEVGQLLSPSAKEMFRCVIAATAADGGTLWILNGGRRSLEAVFNPAEPVIIGKHQAFDDGGIISWVYLSSRRIVARAERRSTFGEKPALASRTVESAAEEADYSSLIDQSLGHQTQSMIALPFECAGELRGVLTLVRLQSQSAPFSAQEQAAAESLATILAQDVERALERRLLE